MKRRRFVELALLGAASRRLRLQGQVAGETLYNGVQLPAPWPPRYDLADLPQQPPYLKNPPGSINIDLGRQLFVDDFLVEQTTLRRMFHEATYHPASPVLVPDRPWESRGGNPTSMVFSDGVFWDPNERLFKMWYMGGYSRSTCLATSRDGIRWVKPALDVVAGTNIVLDQPRDSCTVWLDADEEDPTRRYKMCAFPIGRTSNPLALYVSGDGIHWQPSGQAGVAGDRSTCFWNPFRKVWVYSIRSGGEVGGGPRHRRYVESKTFLTQWTDNQAIPWARADRFDGRRDDIGEAPQLYNLDAVAYESLVLGLFSIWRGDFPAARPKHNDVCAGFSRDGFHWDRSNRQPILQVSERAQDWNWANVQSSGGCCLVVGSRLFFYVSGRRRLPASNTDVCTTGLATMRRDGFASMAAVTSTDGVLTTRPVRFSGRYLFVNADTSGGELQVEVLDEQSQVIPLYSRALCRAFRGDDTCVRIGWENDPDLGSLAGRSVRFRFFLTRGHLYAMWVSPSVKGPSLGYVAAGSPGLPGSIDTIGQLG